MKGYKKIILNVVSTYGRSLLTFVFSLFTARWILAALGKIDFGLYGVVGGIMFLISAFNSTQAATVARFYAYAIGRGGDGPDNDELLEIFNSAMTIHLILPVLFVAIGYPIGLYAIHHWLNIPVDRMTACGWVFVFSLASFLVSVIAVPYSSMYVALQKISTLVAFSLIQVFGLVIAAYSLLYVSSDRLITYAAMVFTMQVTIYFLQIIYAKRHFPACKLRRSRIFDCRRMLQMVRFTGLKSMGDLAWGIKTNGAAFVVNLQFGPVANAALSVANQLATQSETFCRTLANAFTPAITTEEGAGRRVQMIKMSFNCCKYGSALLALVVVPLMIEVDCWLVLWLDDPPAGCGALCKCMLVSCLLTYLTKGHQLAIQAFGTIGVWQVFDSLAYVSAVPLSIVFICSGCGLNSVGYAFVVSMVLICVVRLWFANKLLGMGLGTWAREVAFPVAALLGISLFAAKATSCLFEDGLVQLLAVCCVSIIMVSVCCWLLILRSDDRQVVKNRLRDYLGKVRT